MQRLVGVRFSALLPPDNALTDKPCDHRLFAAFLMAARGENLHVEIRLDRFKEFKQSRHEWIRNNRCALPSRNIAMAHAVEVEAQNRFAVRGRLCKFFLAHKFSFFLRPLTFSVSPPQSDSFNSEFVFANVIDTCVARCPDDT